MKTSRLILIGMLLVSLAVHGLAYGQDYHGIGLVKGTTSPRELGQHYISSYKIKNVLDEAGDTLIVTSLQDTLHSHPGGDITNPNILTVLTWNLDRVSAA
ncbi:MAG: hypothetical protein KBE04_13485, partial [Phycisphaerae bacterium]|nr:hypothetical protein [Phycisphaerae bacterium]